MQSWTDEHGLRCIPIQECIKEETGVDRKTADKKLRKLLKVGLDRTKKSLVEDFRRASNFHLFFSPDAALQVFNSVKCVKCGSYATISRSWDSFSCPCCLYTVWLEDEDIIDYPVATPSCGPSYELLMEAGKQVCVEYKFSVKITSPTN